MYLFHKVPHPANCAFAVSSKGNGVRVHRNVLEMTRTVSEDDIYHVRFSNDRLWPKDYRRNELTPLWNRVEKGGGANSMLHLSKAGELELRNSKDKTLLKSVEGEAVGGWGKKGWMFTFEQKPTMKFYGMGAKCTPFEKSGRNHVFWNVDVFADIPREQIEQAEYDPDYISVPYLIIKQGREFVGILVDSPYASYISPAQNVSIGSMQDSADSFKQRFYLAAEGGAPSVYIIYGPSLPELTRKLQRLTGFPQLPPLWSLGFHQSRWGYGSHSDLEYLADRFEKLRFPVDGLWLDIDYMDEYRVFTFNRKHFPKPSIDLASVQDRGFHVVPIIDPGVKREPGYEVYDGGRKAGAFCRNGNGDDFVGFVWPGKSVFPDFSIAKVQRWWSRLVEEFAANGFEGLWIDMNDPSTGSVPCTGMRFNHGRVSHDAYHNQYGMLMAVATRAGLEKANPGKRVFLLSRSGYTGGQKWAAHWTGDNMSNYAHLRSTVSKSLNLALSGMAVNGPDIGGFAGDVTGRLMIDWVKTGFLFPFYRNHCARDRRRQEPWMLGGSVFRVARRFTRLRYKLLPYLYNLFIRHCEDGDAIIRPLFYDFHTTREFDLDTVDDQFMIGPAIMQAPFLTENDSRRRALLPKERWYRADQGRWVHGGRFLYVGREDDRTPIFLRDKSIIPMQKGIRHDNKNDLCDIELLLCCSRIFAGTAFYRYSVDDGETLDYRSGHRSTYGISVNRKKDEIRVRIETENEGYRPVRFRLVTLVHFRKLVLVRDGSETELRSRAHEIDHFGVRERWYFWG